MSAPTINLKNVISISKKNQAAATVAGSVAAAPLSNVKSSISKNEGTVVGNGMGATEAALRLSQMKEHYGSTISGSSASAAAGKGGRRRGRTQRKRKAARRTRRGRRGHSKK